MKDYREWDAILGLRGFRPIQVSKDSLILLLQYAERVGILDYTKRQFSGLNDIQVALIAAGKAISDLASKSGGMNP